MKKTIIILGLLVMVLGLFANAKLGYEADMELSDKDMISMYVSEEYGIENGEVFIEETDDDEYIEYMVFVNGKPSTAGTIHREYCKQCIMP